MYSLKYKVTTSTCDSEERLKLYSALQMNVTLGDDCTWNLTDDTYITSLKGDVSHIKANVHRLFVNGKEMT